MNLFSIALLVESHNPQDRSQNHPGSMDPSHGFVESDRTASFGSRHSGGADCIVCSNEIQVSRHSSESCVQIARGCARTFTSSVERSSNRGNQGNGRDQAHPLMDL